LVDANLLIRDVLLAQTAVTSLLGTNQNGSIYCGYDLPEKFDPSLGPAIQVYRMGGKSHEEITSLVDPKLNVRVWADVGKALVASEVYGAVHDVLHGLCGAKVADGTILRSLEASGPFEMTDPETGWVAVYAFYQVMATPAAGSSTAYVPRFYEGSGAPTTLENNEDLYYDESTGNLYEQVAGAWVLVGNIPTGGETEMPSSKYHKVAAAGTNAATIKAAAGLLTGGTISNSTGYAVYLHIYDLATLPVPGSSTPAQTIECQAGETVPLGLPSGGVTYSNGIGISITKGLSDTDATAVAAGDCTVDIFYQ
jgi:hypothetical protein